MNKRMREIQAEIAKKAAEAKGYTEGESKDLEKAASLLDEVDALQKEFETLERVEKANKAAVPAEDKPQEKDAIKSFAAAVRARFKGLNEGTGADGGYTVPEDISTLVQEYKQERFSLATLIDYEAVGTMSGRRTFKKRSQHTGFTQVGEGGKVGAVTAPQFEVLEYAIKKFGGHMPVTNELLEDSDAAIVNIVVQWLGEEEIATENAQILAKLAEVEATAMTGLDDIKKAINVTLAAFAGSVSIVTNSDGLQYLDTLTDNNGRYLLSPDPAKPMEMRLAVGARTVPVVVVPNDVAPSADGVIPFIVGDLKEFVKEFDRKQLTLKQSDVAAVTGFNAFEEDLTLIRAIMRADWQIKDASAVVRGALTPKA